MAENNNQPQQPQYVYIQPQRYNEPEELEIDLIELFKVVWKKKRFIFFITFIFAVLSVAYALYLPNIYKGVSRIMPQGSGRGSALSGLAAQYGGLANMMGISVPEGAGGTGAVIVDIIKSDSVVDAIIDKFNLMEQYEQEFRLKARDKVLKNLGADIDTKNGSGVITVSYLDEDPQKAADITNAFVEELQKKMQEIAISSAQQKRAFYESQLVQAQQELAAAEDAMLKYQQSSGVIVLEEQAKRLIESISKLRSEIAAKNVEISSLKTYLRSDNPRLKLAQSQLEGMQGELKRLEEEQRRTDSGLVKGASRDIIVSVGELPEAGVEYQRRVRELKAANSKYEFMFGQYETARLSEVNDFSTVAIIDRATPPDFKDRPGRARICILITFLGGLLPSMWIAFRYIFKESQKFKARRKREEDEEEYDYDYDD